ncbi:pyridoxal-phosphate dependent enzyme, partial [Ectopseudomonas hydrolytica]|uniref:pyridoxal-phosphate dependent enzyme n=1 Tax=Ectopseudomonas hydrolytica TaxID=2493633 RepID=UPI003C2CDD76
MLEQYVKKILTSRVYDVAVETPLQPARQLSERLGSQILLKREDLQPVYSFKIRGAYNKLAQLSAEELARGVVTASAGNHAQGLALAAKHLGVKATIVMPRTTPELPRPPSARWSRPCATCTCPSTRAVPTPCVACA